MISPIWGKLEKNKKINKTKNDVLAGACFCKYWVYADIFKIIDKC